jgi:hypothetical protein
MRIDDLLAFLRERYGLYIDQLPPGEGFAAPTIDERKALRSNVQAFTGRLREIGFLPGFVRCLCDPDRGAALHDCRKDRGSAHMSQGLRELTSQELNARWSRSCCRVCQTCSANEHGHCMRVTDLDRELMVRLAAACAAMVPAPKSWFSRTKRCGARRRNMAVSSTKLVELRNPLPNDELRPPLLVFVPNDLRASAEDSFGVATFEEISIDGAYAS